MQQTVIKLLWGILISLAIALYINFGTFLGPGWGSINYHDLSVYYLGAKYYPELGQSNLYYALLGVIQEQEPQHKIQIIRDPKTKEAAVVSQIHHLIADAKLKFSDQQWRDFTNDSLYFIHHLNEPLEEYLQDYGYNPPPAWTMNSHNLIHFLSSLEIDIEQSVKLLVSLDIILLLCAALLILWSFGAKSLGLAIVFWAANPFDVLNCTGGSFLRFDWLFSVIAAMCLYNRSQYILAGIFMAYAISIRIFPIAFIFPATILFSYSILKNKTINKAFLKFSLSIIMALIILFSLSSNQLGGTKSWQDFYQNISKHNSGVFTNAISFRSLFLLTDQTTFSHFENDTYWGFEAHKRYDYYKPAIIFLTIFLLGLFLYAFRQKPLLDIMLLSCFMPYILFYPSNYYYAFFILLVIYLSNKEPKYIAGFFGLLMLANLIKIFVKKDDLSCFYISYLLLIMMVWLIGTHLAKTISTRHADTKY